MESLCAFAGLAWPEQQVDDYVSLPVCNNNPDHQWRKAMKPAHAKIIALILTTFMAGIAFAAEPQVIDVKLGSYYIKPDKITVKVNQPVTLRIVNESGIVPHNLVIKAAEAGIDVNMDLSGGKSGSATFTPVKTGSYGMHCDKKLPFLKSHDEKGMHGTLEVVE
jgi:plastocyanin